MTGMGVPHDQLLFSFRYQLIREEGIMRVSSLLLSVVGKKWSVSQSVSQSVRRKKLFS